MENDVQSILGNFSIEDMEKFKILMSLMPKAEQKEVVTLRVFCQEYSEFIKQNRSFAYYKSVGNSFKHLLEFFDAQKTIQSIGLKDLENFITYLQKKVPNGYRVYYRTLKSSFNKAIQWEYIKVNYFTKAKLSKRQTVNPAYINSEQLAVICEKLENEVVRNVVFFAFHTGMRLGEIVNIKWKNVNLDTRIITVGDEEFSTKGRNQRYIPICDELYEVLAKIKTGNKKETPSFILPLIKVEKSFQYVFCKSNGIRWTGDYVSKKFKDACKAAGIDKGIHFHSLRHSFASNLAQKGVNLYTIKELLGHSSIVTTERYSHLNMDSLKEAIAKLNPVHAANRIEEVNRIKEHQLKLITN